MNSITLIENEKFIEMSPVCVRISVESLIGINDKLFKHRNKCFLSFPILDEMTKNLFFSVFSQIYIYICTEMIIFSLTTDYSLWHLIHPMK